MALHPVPPTVVGSTYRRPTALGTVRVVVNRTDDGPVEVFVIVGRAGSEVQSFAEALGRVLSAALRLPGPVCADERLALLSEQLLGIGGAHPVGWGPQRALSVVDAVGQILRDALAPSAELPASAVPTAPPAPATPPPATSRDLCPECAGPGLVFSEGCQHCELCGYSRC